MQKSTVVIRKYENRRLYDTSTSRYVNLEDVAAMIRERSGRSGGGRQNGRRPDARRSHADIMEDAKGQPAGLPLELLRQLIVASDRAGQEFIMWYLKAAFDTYHKVQEAVQSGLTDVRSAALSPFQTMRNLAVAGGGARAKRRGRRTAAARRGVGGAFEAEAEGSEADRRETRQRPESSGSIVICSRARDWWPGGR